MAKRRQAIRVRPDQPFKGRQFTAEVILWAVRWYLMFPISYRDLALMLQDRGVAVDHTTIFRWIQAYAPELEKRIRPHLRPTNGSWRVDESVPQASGVDVSVSRGRQERSNHRSGVGQARVRSSEKAPQGAGEAAHGEPAHDNGGQEPGLPGGRRRDESGRRAVASAPG